MEAAPYVRCGEHNESQIGKVDGIGFIFRTDDIAGASHRKSNREILAALVTHYVDECGNVYKLSPRALQKVSEPRAYYILEQMFKEKKPVYCGHLLDREMNMEVTGLSFFRDCTEIIMPMKQDDGAVKEETVKIYHRSPFSDEEVTAPDGERVPLWNLLGQIQTETEPGQQATKTTRQLQLLDIHSSGITFSGKPLTSENIHEVPPHIQVYIADRILLPFRERLVSYLQSISKRMGG
jgi:hypothetical protein